MPEPIDLTDNDNCYRAMSAATDLLRQQLIVLQQMLEQGKPVQRVQTRVNNAYESMNDAKEVFQWDIVQGHGKVTSKLQAKAEEHELS